MNIDNILKELKEQEEAKLAAMTPEERAQWEKHKLEEQENWEAYKAHLAEKVTLTRGEILEQETLTEQAHEQELKRTVKDTLKEAAKRVKPIITSARTSQGGTDRQLTRQRNRIAELEAEVAELKRQRDELLDRLTAATGAKVIP